MKFTLTIDCSNAAFGETQEELANELHRVISAVLVGHVAYYGKGLDQLPGTSYPLRDSNGNRVGVAKFEAAS